MRRLIYGGDTSANEMGTNGPIDRSTLEEVRGILGPTRELIVVNAQAPRGWVPGVNAELSSFALVYRNVELANWHSAIQPFLHEMARDQVHFGPTGATIFTAKRARPRNGVTRSSKKPRS